MMRLFNFERKKYWQKNFSFLFLVLILLLSSLSFIFTYQSSNEHMEFRGAVHPENIIYMNEPENEEEKAIRDKREDVWLFLYEELANYETGQYNKEDDRVLELYIEANSSPINSETNVRYSRWEEDVKNWNLSNLLFRDNEDWSYILQDNTRLANVAQFKYLQENKIEPRKPLNVQQSEEDILEMKNRRDLLFGEEQERATVFINESSSRYDKGWYKIWQLFIENIHLILIGFIILLFGGLLAIERTNKHNHLKFLTSEGVQRNTLYLTKFAVSFSSGLLFLLVAILSVLGTSLFYIGLGSLDYPVLFHIFADPNTEEIKEAPYFMHEVFINNTTNIGLTSIRLSRYLTQSFLLMVFILFFVLCVCYFLSVWIQNELIVVLIGIGLLVSHFVLPLSVYNPISYFDVNRVVSGAVRVTEHSNAMSFEMGVFVLLTWSIILLLIGFFVYQNRQPTRIKGGDKK